MPPLFRFQCSHCNQWHEELPSFDWPFPVEYAGIPVEERADRTELTSDTCVIDKTWYYVRVCLEIPIQGYDEPFIYGVWVSVSETSFALFLRTYEQAGRERESPFFGWLTSVPQPYPQALLKTMVHLRALPTRPYLELEPTEHPLALAQREGLSFSQAQSIAERLLHSGSQ